MKYGFLLVICAVSGVVSSGPLLGLDLDKEELSRRLQASRGQSPEARVKTYCGERVSNLCNKLRSEPGYRDSWLKTMDSLSDAEAATDKAIEELERKLGKRK